MEENFWTKTILEAYRHLETVADAIDKIVMKTALNSRHFLVDGESVFETSNKLIALSERKVTLINLKILTENVLSALSVDEADILICRYVENMKFKDIAEEKGVQIRTVFRRLDRAEAGFANKLLALGYTNDRLKKMLKNEKWIMARLEKQEENAFAVAR